MPKKDLEKLTDEELLAEERKMKSFSAVNAFFIGILLGIIIYSMYNDKNSFLMIITLYLIYALRQNSRNKRLEEIKTILKQRNLTKFDI